MQPSPLRWSTFGNLPSFGEHNENNEQAGRGIFIWPQSHIRIGYFDNGSPSTGNYIIIIFKSSRLEVGEIYWKDGVKWERYTEYNTDGSEKQYDRERW